MGNINNIWYLKGSGQSWADTKCQLDPCFSIPYLPGDNLYLQADIPQPYWVSEVWLCDSGGNRLQELLQYTEWSYLSGDNINKLRFRMPDSSYACTGTPEEGCFVDFLDDMSLPPIQANIEEWANSVANATLEIIYNGVVYDLGAYGDMPSLPPGWAWVNEHTVSLPCANNYPSYVQYQTFSDLYGGWQGTFGNNVQTGQVSTAPLKCWHLEIPLMQGSEATATEVGALASEPFYCPDCQPTLIIKSDYCLSKWDIFGELLFDSIGIDASAFGSLVNAYNDFRIPAVIRKLPSNISANRNARCNNFKSKLVERYKIQSSMDLPTYMISVIESILGGKKLYIDGVEYVPNSEQAFIERGINGYSAVRLDMELVKCEKSVVFDCSCVPEPVNCEDNPLEYSSIVAVNQAPSTAEGEGYTMDDTYWLAKINFGSISGGTPPYTVLNWYTGAGKLIPNSDFEVFNVNSTTTNFFRRNPSDMAETTESVLVEIEDANGCTLTIGNTVVMKDMTCVGFGATFTLNNITSNSAQITAISVPFDCFDVTIDDEASGYQVTGINSLPYVIAGLSPNTDYRIAIRVWCTCPADPDNPMGESSGKIGPIWITTLP